MTKKEVLDKLQERNLDFFSDYGFAAGGKGSIHNTREWGTWKVICEANKRRDQWDLRYHFQVVHQELEAIKKAAEWGFPSSSTISIGQYDLADRHQLADFKHLVIPVKSLPEITYVTQELQKFWKAAVLPFFQQFNGLGALDDWFNTPLLEGNYDWKRAPHLQNVPGSLISAHLNSNPKFEEIQKVWEENLGSVGVMAKLREEMQKLLDYLSVKA